MKTSSVKWLFKATGKNKYKILLLALLQVLLGIGGVVFALLMRGAVDGAVAGKSQDFFFFMWAMVALSAAQIGLKYILRHMSSAVTSTIENSLKSRLLHGLLIKDYAKVNGVHSGEWMNRLTSDTSIVASGITGILPELSGMCVRLGGALVMISALEPKFAVILIPCGIVLFILTYAFRKVVKNLYKNIRESDGRLRVFLQENLESNTIIRSFAVESNTEKEAERKMEDHKSAIMRRVDFMNLGSGGIAVVMNGIYLAGFAYCSYGILMDSLSYGTLMAILRLVGQIRSPFTGLSGFLPRIYSTIASAERLMEVEEFSESENGAAKSREEITRFYNEEFSSVALENVYFSYPGEGQPLVLKGVNLEISKGRQIAFVGHSGCGKSTMMKLIMNLYSPDKGEIILKKVDGEKKKMGSDMRRLFAYVPQEKQLMSGTIRDVVAFSGQGEVNNEKVYRALEIACALDFVRELKDGIDTLLGERGAGLSEGQLQRIAVARAIYSDSPILLLDESTSALDENTEKKLLQNIRNMTDRTVIMISHRLGTLGVCDKIYRVSEQGVKEQV